MNFLKIMKVQRKICANTETSIQLIKSEGEISYWPAKEILTDTRWNFQFKTQHDDFRISHFAFRYSIDFFNLNNLIYNKLPLNQKSFTTWLYDFVSSTCLHCNFKLSIVHHVTFSCRKRTDMKRAKNISCLGKMW